MKNLKLEILDETSKKLLNALQNKDLTTVFVAQAIIETTDRKIKNTNTNIVLNKKKKQRTVEKKTVNSWHAKRGNCSKKEKSGDINSGDL